MVIGLSQGGSSIYSSTNLSDEILVGTNHGIAAIARDSHDHWHVTNRSLVDQHISAIVKEPASGLIFASAYNGSISVSADYGKTWEPRDQGIPQPKVFSLAVQNLEGQVRLFAGTEPAHLFSSDDLGLHWQELPSLRSVPSLPKWKFPAPPHIAHIKHISFDPVNPSTIYASVEVGGLLRSDDGGDRWQEFPDLYEDVHRLLIHPLNPKFLFAVTGRGLYVSPNQGDRWEQWTKRGDEIGGYPDGFVFLPSDPKTVFIAAAQDSPSTWLVSHFAGSQISRSNDGGQTWKILHNGLPRLKYSIEALAIEETPQGTAIFAATSGGEIIHSNDLGESWRFIIKDLSPISKVSHYIHPTPDLITA